MASTNQLIGLILLVLIILHRLYRTVYLLFFSPIRAFPGPKLWAISRLPYQISLMRGHPHLDLLALHKRYGPVVRIAPDQLAFFTGQSFRDIYDRFGAKSFKKNRMHYQPPTNGVDHLVTAINNDDHARYRKAFNSGFTREALKAQEPLVMHYADWLIQRLEDSMQAGPVPISDLFNCTLFDITGELMFGESFGCLAENKIHPWISLLFTSTKVMVFVNAAKQYSTLNWLLRKAIPKSLLQKEADHFRLSAAKADQRLEMGSERADLMSGVIKNGFSEIHGQQPTEKKALSRAEIHSNVYLMIIAGSETTATALSGMAYYLCKSPKVMELLVQEIRSSFASSTDITFNSTNELPYLKAVIDEALRMYPPVAHGLARTPPPGGGVIDGHFVPEGITVATHHYATYHSPSNFNLADEFHPERWLGADPSFANDNLDAVQQFGMGARVCMGKNLAYAEIRLIFAKLLYQFDIKLHSQSKDWIDQEVFYIWNKKKLTVQLKKREDIP